MNFVSYAQNFEDVMLWRALKHVASGCYVDVGAQHPIVDSVSKAFYERGWRGVHIEPSREYAELLHLDRPDETVIEAAASNVEGFLTLHEFGGTGLSTAIGEYSDSAAACVGAGPSDVVVPSVTLASCLSFLAGKDVHWLKIDVEGFERQVLEGWDSTTLRPWILLIEATVPQSQQLAHGSWEPIVLGAGYEFVYFDGLNRFYVDRGHPELKAAFATPPNVFDAFRLSGLASSELCRGMLESAREIQAQLDGQRELVSRLEPRVRRLEADLDVSQRALQERDRIIADIYHSRSWRLTAPLRWLNWQTHLLRRDGLTARASAVTRRIVRTAFAVTLGGLRRWPFIKPLGVRALRIIGLYDRLYRLRIQVAQTEPSRAIDLAGTDALSPRARQILADLQQAVARRQQEPR